jgi:hypothetical protein
VLGRNGDAGEAELPGRAEEVFRELARLVDERGPRTDDLLGEGADRVAEELLLLGQLEINWTRSIPGKPAAGRPRSAPYARRGREPRNSINASA